MKQKISFTLNGKQTAVESYGMERLLDVLREECGATGTKEGCGEGECGACSIFVDGVLVNSCLVPALQVDGKDVVTIEGIATSDQGSSHLSAVQQAFIDKNGAQCGICTPGMIMATVALLKKHPDPTDEQIRYGLGGNLCRCTGYMKIIDAVKAAVQNSERGI